MLAEFKTLGQLLKNKLNPKQKELFTHTDEVLHYLWDPIGVSDSAYARDEYDTHSLQVFKKLIQNNPKEEIIDYLVLTESDSFGLQENRKKAKHIAEVLIDYKKKILGSNL